MKILKEQAYGSNWGIDVDGILYPAVSSCITLTYYFPAPSMLAGMHLGLHMGGGGETPAITSEDVRRMHESLLSDARLRGAQPSDAAIVGAIGVWQVNNPDAFSKVRGLASSTLALDLADMEFVHELDLPWEVSEVVFHTASYVARCTKDPSPVKVKQRVRPWTIRHS